MLSKIIVLGSNGQLGSDIVKKLSETSNVIPIDRNECDISDVENLKQVFTKHSPNVVINCAAYTNVDLAEEEMEKCFKVNHEALKYLSTLSNQFNFTLIHFSTDYVFNPKISKPIEENAPKGPINVYGKSKLAGEQEIIDKALKYYIFRVCWVYGHNGKNFPKTILNLAKSKEELDVVNDQFGSPTPTTLISDVICEVLGSSDFGEKTYGTYHISPNGCCSWLDVATQILRFSSNKIGFKLKKVNPVSSDNFASKAKRPSYSYLENKKLKNTFNVNIKTWEFYLNNFLGELND